MGKAKGVGFTFNILVEILLIAAGIGVGIFLIVNIGGGAGSLLGCDQNPELFWCGGDSKQDSIDFEIAKKNAESVTCAINAVITGNKDKCDNFKDTGDVTALAVASVEDPIVECNNLGEKVTITKLGEVQAISTPIALELCKREFGEIVNKVEYEGVYARDVDLFSCHREVDKVDCTIKNFNLPQEVSDAEDWIIGYGDPELLVYWQDFPAEEDTWSFQADWRVHALVAAVSILPVTKVFGIAAKAGKTALAGAIKGASRAAVKRAIKQQVKKNLVTFIKQRLTTAKGLRSVIIRGVALEVAVHAAEIAEELAGSVLAKLDPQTNSIALKKPYNDPNIFSLDESWKGMPVVIEWNPSIWEKSKQFHLASPCHIDKMDVEMDDALCRPYIEDTEDGSVTCQNPTRWDGEGYDTTFTCGEITEGINDAFGNQNGNQPFGTLEKFNDLKTLMSEVTNKKIFEHDESNSDNTKIFLRRMNYWTTSDPKETYITMKMHSILKPSSTMRLGSDLRDHNREGYVYEATLHIEGREETLENFYIPCYNVLSTGNRPQVDFFTTWAETDDEIRGPSRLGPIIDIHADYDEGRNPYDEEIDSYVWECVISPPWSDDYEDDVGYMYADVRGVGYTHLGNDLDYWDRGLIDDDLSNVYWNNVGRTKDIHRQQGTAVFIINLEDDNGNPGKPFAVGPQYADSTNRLGQLGRTYKFLDGDGDGLWDGLTAERAGDYSWKVDKHAASVGAPYSIPFISIQDIDPETGTAHRTMQWCKTKGIFINDIEKREIEGENNYCIREKDTGAIVWDKVGTPLVAAVTVVIAVIYPPAALTVAVIGAAIEGTGDYLSERNEGWPN